MNELELMIEQLECEIAVMKHQVREAYRSGYNQALADAKAKFNRLGDK